MYINLGVKIKILKLYVFFLILSYKSITDIISDITIDIYKQIIQLGCSHGVYIDFLKTYLDYIIQLITKGELILHQILQLIFTNRLYN